MNVFSWKVCNKLESANPAEVGTGGLEKSMADMDYSSFINDVDDSIIINGVLYISLAE